MFSKATHWLIDGLLHREHQAAAAQQGQQAATGTAGSETDKAAVAASNGAGSAVVEPAKAQDKVGCCPCMLHSQQA
jgi:hypothetical protein